MAEICCPIWGKTQVTTLCENGVWFVYSPRAGGVYGLTGQWGVEAERGRSITDLIEVRDREKANLSHWIYHQNLKAGLLRPPAPWATGRCLD